MNDDYKIKDNSSVYVSIVFRDIDKYISFGDSSSPQWRLAG